MKKKPIIDILPDGSYRVLEQSKSFQEMIADVFINRPFLKTIVMDSIARRK